MCGICGVVSTTELPNESSRLVKSMCSALAHRGPDAEGFSRDRFSAMGARRLSIIDRAHGDQPMTNEDQSLQVVFNGEIYNHEQLRTSLQRRGHRFRSASSDTEVLVHAYEEYGSDCPRHLHGMFAFAIWDRESKRLFAARDRLGQKPFHYARSGDHLWFASELKALALVPGLADEVDELAIHHYLSLQYIPEPSSIYQDIRKLPPAHSLRFESGRIHLERYWDLEYEPKLDIDEADAADELRRLVSRSVRQRLMSEVPLGAFLSGGIDSSIVVGSMAEQSSRPVETFSIGFTFEALDELPRARKVADFWNTKHHELVVTPERFEDLLPKLADAFDEPFGDASAFQSYHLARETRRHVTVALNGDGGDELFAGYSRYWLDRYVRCYGLLPPLLTQHAVPAMVDRLPEPRQVAIEANWVLGLKRLAQVARISPKASILRWGSFFDEELKLQLYRPSFRERLAGKDTTELLIAQFDHAKADSFLDRTLAVDTNTYLTGDLLVKADRMTMAHSLEARSPFLDHRLVEFAARLPAHFKLRGRQGKWLLRKAFSRSLPPGIENLPKRGFAAPIEAWLRDDLRSAVHDLILSSDSKIHEYLSKKAIEEMVDQHQQSKRDHGRRIWALLMLETWFRRRSRPAELLTESTKHEHPRSP